MFVISIENMDDFKGVPNFSIVSGHAIKQHCVCVCILKCKIACLIKKKAILIGGDLDPKLL